MIAQDIPDQLFILAKTIDVGGVEKALAPFDGMQHQVARTGFLTGRIELRKPHAAQADGAERQPVGACLAKRQRDIGTGGPGGAGFRCHTGIQ